MRKKDPERYEAEEYWPLEHPFLCKCEMCRLKIREMQERWRYRRIKEQND